MKTLKIYFLSILSILFSECTTNEHTPNGDSNDFSISASNETINDLGFLISIKLRDLNRERDSDNNFTEKLKEIELKKTVLFANFEKLIDSIWYAEGNSRPYVMMDFTGDFEDLPDEYKKMVIAQNKIDQLRKSKNIATEEEKLDNEKIELKKSYLIDLIKNDETLMKLVKKYKQSLIQRSDMLKLYGINPADSINFFSKKMKTNLNEETVKLIQEQIF